MPAATTRRLKTLGRQLRDRRKELGYLTMRALWEATPAAVRPSYEMMMAAENGTRHNISSRTWEAIAATYWASTASVTAVLDGHASKIQPVPVPAAERARALADAAGAAAGSLADAAAVLRMLAAPDRRQLARGARLLAAAGASADIRGLAAPAQVLTAIAGLDRASLLRSAQVLSGLADRAAALPADEDEQAASPAPRAAG
jgi:hypothetical protein